MDKRTKILACVFGVAVGYGILSQTVYPRWIEPLLTLDERLASRNEELRKLEDRQAEVDQGKREYMSLVERVGSTDIMKVEVDLRARINDLIEELGIKDLKTSGGRVKGDRKTGLETMFIDLTGTASLESSIRFLKALSELPQLVRIPRPKLSPASSSRKKKQVDRVNLHFPIEVMVLPALKIIGKVEQAGLKQPASHVRHKDQDYALIWKRELFTEYIPPKPLVVRIPNRRVNARVGSPLVIRASAVGGDGAYTFHWTPSEGLDDPAAAKTRVDTSKPMEREYTVHVSDGAGQSATQTVSVSVKEKPKPPPPPPVQQVVDEKPKPPPPPPKDTPWDGGKNMKVCMALITGDGSQQLGELMLFDMRYKTSDYFKVGDEFDGGELVYLHTRGGVAVRNDEYFVYPIGQTLDRALSVAVAGDHPQLQAGAERHQAAKEAAVQAAKEALEQADAEQGAADQAAKDAEDALKPKDASLAVDAGTKDVDAGQKSMIAKPATAVQKAGKPDGVKKNVPPVQIPKADASKDEGKKKTAPPKRSKPRSKRRRPRGAKGNK